MSRYLRYTILTTRCVHTTLYNVWQWVGEALPAEGLGRSEAWCCPPEVAAPVEYCQRWCKRSIVLAFMWDVCGKPLSQFFLSCFFPSGIFLARLCSFRPPTFPGRKFFVYVFSFEAWGAGALFAESYEVEFFFWLVTDCGGRLRLPGRGRDSRVMAPHLVKTTELLPGAWNGRMSPSYVRYLR